MALDPIPRLDILRVFEYLGGEAPAYVKSHAWTPVRCVVHGGMSASIHAEAQKYYCFGCDAHGDAYDLLRLVEGIELAEARELAEERGWVVGDGRPVKGPPRRTAPPSREQVEQKRKPRRR